MTVPDVPLIPRDVLFGNPTNVSPRLSPDGRRLAWIAPHEGVLNVWVGALDRSGAKVVTDDKDRGIRRYFWAHDNKHILYMQDVGGNENWRLFRVDPDTPGSTTCLTPFENVQVRLVERNKDYPERILIAMNKENEQLHDVYSVDIASGELTMVAENRGDIVGWSADSEMKIRGAMTARPDGGFNLVVRDTPDADWRTVVEWSADDSLNSGLVVFSKDGRSVILRDSRGVNAGRLVRLSLADGSQEVLASDETYDVSDVMIHPDTWAIEAVAFAKDREQWEVLDDSVRDDFAQIEKLDRGDFAVSSRTHDDNRWIVAFTADNGPVAFWRWDRTEKKGAFLFHHRPELSDAPLTEMEPVRFTARDGLTIHGYLTCPPGVEKKNLPVVLNVHGGPWARDTWGFDPQAQWFANRGYACLQVNYRGSTGYGKNFLNAGDREWGGKMHDDLVDAVEWLVGEGIADRERVAIFGGSYGGYAALVGATFTPEVFRCAVDIVGPSSLLTLIESIPPYWVPLLSNFKRRVGDPETEKAFLESRSPLFKASEVRIPMLIAQGANDPRVKQAEAEQFVKALKEKGIDHEYMLFEDEGHGFAKPENRMTFFAAAEKFLAKHLGGRCEE